MTFEPLGVAQGWSPASYAFAVRALQKMGYRRIALGGMVPLKTDEILACLEQIDEVRRARTQLHLLGITRCEHVDLFAERRRDELRLDLHLAAFVMEKDSKRFSKSGGWGYAVFNYDAASDKFTPDPKSLSDCGYACHTPVKAKDYIFHPYQKR